MKIEIHGRQVEVDDSFKDMSEDEQHQVVDEIAAGLMPTASQAAATQEAQESQGPDVLPNIGAGAEAAALRYGVGVPAVWGIDKVKKLLGGADKALPVQPALSPLPGEERWFNSANAINEKAKIVRRNNELAKRYPQFERMLPPEPPIPLKEKVVSGLQGLRTSPGGKAFTSGYNLMDVAEHAGEGTLGNAQATASGLAALAPYAEKYLPGKYKKVAKALQLGTPAANYVIDKFTGQPVPVTEQKAAGGAIQHLAGGKLVEDAAKAALKKLNLADFEGKTLLGTLADRTKVGDGFKGGPMFPTVHPGAAWAMDAPGAASRLLNAMHQAGGPESTIVAPMLMSNQAHRSNRDVAKMAADRFKQNYEAGMFPEDRLKEIEARIRKIKGLEEHPGMMDPNAKNIMDKLTFSQRGELVDVLGSKPKQSMALDLDKLLRETTEPGLYEEPLGAIGPSVFKLSGERSIDPTLHGSYSHILHGEPVGAINPIPREFLFRDLEAKANKELGRPLSDYNYRTSVGIPSQLIDDKLLKSLDELGFLKPEGYAPGGKVMKAAVEEFKKKFTPGFYHGSPSNKIEVFDPNKSMKDPMMAVRNATFVSRNPNFAESFLVNPEKEKVVSGATMYPVSVNLGKHFDAATPEGSETIKQYLLNKYKKEPGFDDVLNQKHEHYMDRLTDPLNNWNLLESPDLLNYLKSTGYDTFSVTEGGVKNVGIFNPKNIRGKFAKYNPEDAESPDFMKAAGGEVQSYAGGKQVLSGLGALMKHPHGQDPKVAQALEEYLKGNISQADRINILNQQLPIRKWTDLPPNYTDEQIRNALMANKQSRALVNVPAGTQVGNRLDIPAYTQHGVYVDTTHDAAGKPISYGRTGHLKDVEFSSKPNQAVRVGLGTKEQALTPMGAEIGSAKSPFALIKGTNVGTSDEEVRRMMAEMMKDPAYTQIGMDPRRHSQFYDKSTGLPVWAAEEKLQSGPLIIAPKRGLETTSWDDPRLNLSDFPNKKYKKGSKVKKK